MARPEGPDGSTPVAALRACLQAGIGGGDAQAAALRAGLPPGLPDAELAQRVVTELDAALLAEVALSRPGTGRGQRRDPSHLTRGRASFLMRLADGAEDPGVDIAQLEDLRTLQAIVLAGTLQQRRAATVRLGEVLEEPKGQSAERVRSATQRLLHLRKWDLAYELSQACARLPGADGRRARTGRKEWERLAEQVQQSIVAYWDGEHPEEPLRALHGDQRAQLLSRARDLPEVVVRQLCAILEGCDGVQAPGARVAIAHALRNAADPRLLPSLRAALLDRDPDLTLAAARALSRIDDPRVQPLLRAAYARAVRPQERLTLAGALGLSGDRRGLGYVREVLAEDDTALLPPALEALRYLGTSDDVQRVTELLDHDDPLLVVEAVKSLGRIGDGRALQPLSRLSGLAARSAVRAEVEEATAALQARMELLGEEPPSFEGVQETFDTQQMAAIKRRDPATVRARARWSLLLGALWRALGASVRAIARFERAAALRPRWVRPVLLVAMVHARRDEYAQALGAFRRALEIDRAYVERNHTAVRLLARSFLRRAEAVEAQGRADVARALIEEALSLDLRRAPSGLRFALSQRHEAMREME